MQSFGFSEAPAVWRTGAFNSAQQGYLAHHRADVFVA
jgi:hypothetical protein